LFVCNILYENSIFNNKKADNSFVDRDEVASKLRGTTRFEPAYRDMLTMEWETHIRLDSTWFVW